jgi:teichuronic acid biosynthesis glycosyltransferase TuaG
MQNKNEEQIFTEPLVSVVIPTYNRASFLKQTIESVLNQTYKNIELIVVDDGSTDNTKDVISPYLHRIQYIFTENKGPAHARNIGMKTSKGKYISLLDSDDEFLPFKIEAQVSLMEKNPDIGMVFSEFSASGESLPFQERHLRYYFWLWEKWSFEDIFAKKGEYTIFSLGKSVTYYTGSFFDYAILGWLISSFTMLFSRKILDVIGYQQEDCRTSEDYEFSTRISKHFKVGFIDFPLYIYHYHKGQYISAFKKQGRDVLVVVKANTLYLNTVINLAYNDKEYYNKRKSIIDKRMGDLYNEIGVNWLEYGDAKAARRSFKKSYFFDKGRKRFPVYWLISFMPSILIKFMLELKSKKN